MSHSPVFFFSIIDNFIHFVPEIKSLEAILYSYLIPHSQSIGKPCPPFHQNKFQPLSLLTLPFTTTQVVELAIILQGRCSPLLLTVTRYLPQRCVHTHAHTCTCPNTGIMFEIIRNYLFKIILFPLLFGITKKGTSRGWSTYPIRQYPFAFSCLCIHVENVWEKQVVHFKMTFPWNNENIPLDVSLYIIYLVLYIIYWSLYLFWDIKEGTFRWHFSFSIHVVHM